MGCGKAFDYDRFFVFCGNMLGSPYGSASPLTINPESGHQYGPEFPQTTFRDDVRVHKLVLDALGVSSVAAAIGGSMGGMAVLEWPLCTPTGYVQQIIPITTSAYHSAWGISWGEAQRQCIYADTTYKSGWYTPLPSSQPAKGLGAARMIAMLTYRSHQSFHKRFNRRPAKPSPRPAAPKAETSLPTPSPSDGGSGDELKSSRDYGHERIDTEKYSKAGDANNAECSGPITYAAQSYMQYQASKFLKRFDANCYVHLTLKMDTHDVTRDRLAPDAESDEPGPSIVDLKRVLRDVPARGLVISIESDVPFRNEHQIQLADCLPDARFVNLHSQDGHDGFLSEFEALSDLIRRHLQEQCPWLYARDLQVSNRPPAPDEVISSVFGEAEPDF